MRLASLSEIRKWFNNKDKKNGATHMLIVFNNKFKQEFPVYSKSKEETKEIYEKYEKSVDFVVLSVFSYKLNLTDQLKEKKAMHFE